MGAVISSARTHALRGELLLSSEPIVTSLGEDAQSYWLAQEGDPKRSQMNVKLRLRPVLPNSTLQPTAEICQVSDPLIAYNCGTRRPHRKPSIGDDAGHSIKVMYHTLMAGVAHLYSVTLQTDLHMPYLHRVAGRIQPYGYARAEGQQYRSHGAEIFAGLLNPQKVELLGWCVNSFTRQACCQDQISSKSCSMLERMRPHHGIGQTLFSSAVTKLLIVEIDRKFAEVMSTPGISRSNSASTESIRLTISSEVRPTSRRYRPNKQVD